MKRCRVCNKLLILDKNWLRSSKKYRSYICNKCKNERHSIYKKENKDIVNSQRRRYYENNKEVERKKARIRKLKNRKYYTYLERTRKANKKLRTPSWADLEGIEFFYLCCPKGYEVDHIIPLQGKTVSGFHILENLQYLTKEENLKKGNRF